MMHTVIFTMKALSAANRVAVRKNNLALERHLVVVNYPQIRFYLYIF